ncbi:hypothetical protein [Ktedonobacter robiniae]|uniref:Resolvase HTH domain-containing protein n=1 Tax=Ktedonobacter robiniae TaxID=2778365 RepID=A0ABQ3UNX4_9CHLR|nr:hypothetical protein [Ktedonobacter robiniae]GHO54434.1 hypothetical protein KSB_29090 [Ktedonobacter robiniae]
MWRQVIAEAEQTSRSVSSRRGNGSRERRGSGDAPSTGPPKRDLAIRHPPPPAHPSLSPAQREEAIALLQQPEMPIRKVASALGTSRGTNHRSHLALIPIDKLFAGRGDILIFTPKASADYAQSGTLFEQALGNQVDIPLSQRRPGPDTPQWKIPVSEWPNVVRRIIENQEPLRKVAMDYGVSYETVRRVINAVQKRTS